MGLIPATARDLMRADTPAAGDDFFAILLSSTPMTGTETRPRFVLHIGATKTGSSALQAMLARNRRLLVQNGVLYPTAGEHSNSHHLIAAASHPNAWMMHRSRVPEPPEERTRYLHDMVSAAREEAARFGAHTILLSSEYWWGRLPPENIGNLAKAFGGHEVDVVAVVRRPDDWLFSSYLQAVKSGATEDFADWGAVIAKSPLRGFDFHDVLASWRDGLRPANMIVLRYQDVKSSIFNGFTSSIGLNLPEKGPGPRVNLSPTIEGLHRLLEVNRSTQSDDMKAALRAEVLERHSSASQNANRLGDAERSKILDQAAIMNARLTAEFLGSDRPLF